MLKRMIFALAIAGLGLGVLPGGLGPQPAEARTDFNVYLGVPYYGYRVAPHYRYYDGRGWYDPYRYGYMRPDRMSCGEARRLVRDSGYRDVTVRDCGGRVYAFGATRKGNRYIVYVNAFTGRIWR